MLMLKAARKKSGKTQKEVAEAIGISQNGYSQWESGVRRIDKDSLAKLADLFGVTVDYLLGRTEKLLNEEHAGSINLANIQLHSDEDFNKKKPPASEDDERQALANASDETKLALELLNRLTPENRAKAMDHLDYLLDRQEGSEDKK